MPAAAACKSHFAAAAGDRDRSFFCKCTGLCHLDIRGITFGFTAVRNLLWLHGTDAYARETVHYSIF